VGQRQEAQSHHRPPLEKMGGSKATATASRASLAPTDQTFLRGKRWASLTLSSQPTRAMQTRCGFMHGSPKSAAVCRAEWRVEWSRCTVRMTVRGSVTPGMACGSRPVEGNPQLGAFPAVGIRPGPGLPRGRPFPPWPAPANGRLVNRPCR
jgi:hypothetical protein